MRHSRPYRRARRVWHRGRLALGISDVRPGSIPPAAPVGGKLELTYACNLRCGFCYTDSPRRTLERTPELSDDEWRAITRDVIESGVIEAVVTGGEPLLRKELTVEVIGSLLAADVGVSFNTNGWFVDDDVADRLAALGPGLNVHISLDGPTPEIHERSRGVPGSWRRAIAAIARLVERGIPVHVVHVVTPDNVSTFEEVVRHGALLGAESIRLTPVVPIGAAARGGDWRVDELRLRRQAERLRERLGADFDVIVASEVDMVGPASAPAYFVVRPDGSVLAGSLTPFRFGHALDDGIAACWSRVVHDWNNPHVQRWRRPLRMGTPLSAASAVLYRDDELDIDNPPPEKAPPVVPVALPQAAKSVAAGGSGDLGSARREVTKLALERRYRLGAIKATAGENGGRYLRSPNGAVMRLNATAAAVMDACAEGTPADAVARLKLTARDVEDEAVEDDVLATVGRLSARGVLRPALAS